MPANSDMLHYRIELTCQTMEWAWLAHASMNSATSLSARQSSFDPPPKKEKKGKKKGALQFRISDVGGRRRRGYSPNPICRHYSIRRGGDFPSPLMIPIQWAPPTPWRRRRRQRQKRGTWKKVPSRLLASSLLPFFRSQRRP